MRKNAVVKVLCLATVLLSFSIFRLAASFEEAAFAEREAAAGGSIESRASAEGSEGEAMAERHQEVPRGEVVNSENIVAAAEAPEVAVSDIEPPQEPPSDASGEPPPNEPPPSERRTDAEDEYACKRRLLLASYGMQGIRRLEGGACKRPGTVSPSVETKELGTELEKIKNPGVFGTVSKVVHGLMTLLGVAGSVIGVSFRMLRQKDEMT